MWDCSALEDDLGPAALGAGSPEPVLWSTVQSPSQAACVICVLCISAIALPLSPFVKTGRYENIQRAQLTFTFTGAESIFIKTSRFLLLLTLTVQSIEI